MSSVAAPLQPLLIIAGPTASGKTALAVELCRRLNGEIISADSMQVYRGCDIVTAKPSAEELAAAPHHLLDIINPDERYSAAEWAKAADTLIDSLRAEGKTPIICGGTGFYIRALLEPDSVPAPPSDPELRAILESDLAEHGAEVMHQRLQQVNPTVAERIHPNDHYRVLRALEIALGPNLKEEEVPVTRHQPVAFAYEWPREELYARIEQRVDLMLEAGALDETRRIREVWGADAPALGGVGYKQLLPALDDPAQLPECMETWKRDTRRYAKRQLTWFRHQLPVAWLGSQQSLDEIVNQVAEAYNSRSSLENI